MSVTRFYSCDLCRGQIGGLIGIYWESKKGPEEIALRPAKGNEHHLCRKCFQEIRAASEPADKEWFHP